MLFTIITLYKNEKESKQILKEQKSASRSLTIVITVTNSFGPTKTCVRNSILQLQFDNQKQSNDFQKEQITTS